MSRDITIDELVVIDFHTTDLTPEIQDWKEKAAVPFAASCARQIWYGTQDDFEDFPFPEDYEKVDFLQGPDAYADLLRVVSGFESKRVGETHIRSQFYDGWRCFNEEYPEIARDYQTMIGMIKQDVNFIRNHITSNFKQQRHEHAARDLSGQEKGDSILVIPTMGRGTNIGTFTEGIIRLSENKQKHRDNFLSITHPEPEMLERLSEEVKKMRAGGQFRSNIEVLPFEDIAQHFEQFDRVYVDMPMDSNPEAEAEIIGAWKNRVRTDNTMTHMRGDPKNRALSSAQWSEAGLDSFVSPEDIRHDMADRGRNNKQVLLNAESAFSMCAELRWSGLKPENNIVLDENGPIIK